MGSHFEKRIFSVLLVGLLHVGSAHASDDLVIRGDQSKSLLSEVPLPLKALPDWFFEESPTDADAQLKKLLADVELFTRTPATTESNQNSNSIPPKDKPNSTAADGATP
ncbi:MAG: hypothetical protein FJY29_06980 [Betaproteobacteria bacterium]|nr:hypothetical protein [Betaproteobacteria bacterium]